VVKKKSAAQKKPVGKKSVTTKKKVAVKNKAKSVKNKALPKKSAVKKAKPPAKPKAKSPTKTKAKTPIKAKVKSKTKAKTPIKAKVKSKTKAKTPAKPNARIKVKTKAPLKNSTPTKIKTVQKKEKKAAPKKAVPKKKSVTETVSEESTPVVEKKAKVVVRQSFDSADPVVIKIREKLIENRAEVLKMLESSQAMERDVEGLTFSNEIDLASSLEGREMVFQLSSRDRRELKLIDDALIKIKEGSYGICESCDKKISSKRLQILPLTTLCIECKESAEKL